MNNTYHIEGDFLVRKRGGLGDFNPNEILRRLQELIEFYSGQGVKRKHLAFRRIAREFKLKISTVKWVYMVTKDGYAGKHRRQT